MPTDFISREISHFLKNRRASLLPADFGFTIGRRRTKGLRREEVSQLSGVSATWYTWLEQGKNIRVSQHMINNLSSALRLNTTERKYLSELVQQRDITDPVLIEIELSSSLIKTVDSICSPAYVRNHRWDLLYWNKEAEIYIGQRLNSQQKPNILKLAFLDEKHRATICNWNQTAQEMIAQFRRDFGRFAKYQGFVDIVTELLKDSETFRRGWGRQEICLRETGLRIFLHPTKGELTFERTCLALDNDMLVKLEVYTSVETEGRA